MIVVDALDEAPKKTVKELFRLLEDVAGTAQDRPRLPLRYLGGQSLRSVSDRN